jgi:GntR family transcriptional regulator of gluconate operon
MATVVRDSKVHHPKLFETVAERLREAIIGGELRPGDKLVETELADRFGVSRGPIREALRELTREGLAVDLPRRGTIVSAATLGDLTEVYDVREALEKLAVTLAINNAKAADYARLRERFKRMDRLWSSKTAVHADRVNADIEFHREIFRLAGNSRAIAMFDQLGTQTALLLRNAMDLNPTLRLSPPEEVHANILDALLERNAEAARAAVTNHYRHTRERLFTSLAPPVADDEPAPADRVHPDARGKSRGARKAGA